MSILKHLSEKTEKARKKRVDRYQHLKSLGVDVQIANRGSRLSDEKYLALLKEIKAQGK